jgi:hypothetical protein
MVLVPSKTLFNEGMFLACLLIGPRLLVDLESGIIFSGAKSVSHLFHAWR